MAPPLVYVGPSLDGRTVKRWLPAAQLMPPIRRGDLYRDRMLGFSVFLMLDGVFFQRLAVSPREIVDVVQDGGVVFGASSMGAMRAAECWPAGMRGAGSIYRLFRRGVLESDDEVAVAFSAVPPYTATTVPLVNIRYALHRAVRYGLLPRDEACRLAEAASNLHFAGRHWTSLPGYSDLPAPVRGFLRECDLKALDAGRALRAVHRWTGRQRGTSPRRSRLSSHLLSGALTREAPASAPVRAATPGLWRWALASGFYRRHLSCASAIGGPDPGSGTLDVLEHLWTRGDAQPRPAAAMERAATMSALLMRHAAIARGAATAHARGLVPTPGHRRAARSEIADNHGVSSWRALGRRVAGNRRLRAAIHAAGEELALAKRWRDELFRTRGQRQ